MLSLAIMLALGMAVLAPAGQAHEVTAESLAAKVEKATQAAERAAARAEHAAQRVGQRRSGASQRASAKQKRTAERIDRREARRKSRESIRQALKEKDGNVVTIDCEKVTVAYHNFPVGTASPNYVSEQIVVKNPPESISKYPIVFPKSIYSFEGASGTDVVPIAFPVGHYLIDIHAEWDTNGHKGDFDIHGNVTCLATPAYTISKLQSIAGSGKAPTSETLTGKVGQVVDYQITVANTGNTPLKFTNFTDSPCDERTLVGGSLAAIEPLETLTFTCSHTLTTANQTAGSYTNVASVTGTPEQSEGHPVTEKSNAVVVTIPAEEKHEENHEEKAEEKHEEKHEEKSAQKTEETKPKSEVPGTYTTVTTPGKSGVLGFTSATVPALKGPQGCVRSAFTASIRANGVSSVIFYLDGHRISRMTSKNAHRGLLSVRINPAKLRVGVHRLKAQITMKQGSGSATAARASRQLTVIRCKSAVITPRFTG